MQKNVDLYTWRSENFFIITENKDIYELKKFPDGFVIKLEYVTNNCLGFAKIL